MSLFTGLFPDDESREPDSLITIDDSVLEDTFVESTWPDCFDWLPDLRILVPPDAAGFEVVVVKVLVVLSSFFDTDVVALLAPVAFTVDVVSTFLDVMFELLFPEALSFGFFASCSDDDCAEAVVNLEASRFN